MSEDNNAPKFKWPTELGAPQQNNAPEEELVSGGCEKLPSWLTGVVAPHPKIKTEDGQDVKPPKGRVYLNIGAKKTASAENMKTPFDVFEAFTLIDWRVVEVMVDPANAQSLTGVVDAINQSFYTVEKKFKRVCRQLQLEGKSIPEKVVHLRDKLAEYREAGGTKNGNGYVKPASRSQPRMQISRYTPRGSLG